MAAYLQDTQRRSGMPDRAAMMVAYTKMDLAFEDLKPAVQEAKVSQLKEVAVIAAERVHGAVDSDVQIREGSVNAEILILGHLHEILSINQLVALDLLEKGKGLVELGGELLLDYATIRGVLAILVKDMKVATSALAQFTRWVFGANRRDMLRSETRTGVVGYWLRGLDALDVASAKGNTLKKRADAMKRASKQFISIERATGNKQDRRLLSKYLTRELERISEIEIDDSISKSDRIHAEDFNHHYKTLCDTKTLLSMR